MGKLSDRFDSRCDSGVTLTSVVPMETRDVSSEGAPYFGGEWRNRVIDTLGGNEEKKLGIARFGNGLCYTTHKSHNSSSFNTLLHNRLKPCSRN